MKETLNIVKEEGLKDTMEVNIEKNMIHSREKNNAGGVSHLELKNHEVRVYIERCREGARIPEYKNSWDAGMDVCAYEDVILKPGETKIVSTGLKFAIPRGYEIQVRPRSGISVNTPLRIANTPGTIDTGYRGELGIIVSNTSDEKAIEGEDLLLDLTVKGNRKGTYHIKKEDRIAQIVLCEIPRMKFEVVEDVGAIGEDRGGGFGSTGIK